MCVAALAWRVHPDWPIVAYGNRDERHARPTRRLTRWEDCDIIAGRDLESGGTWLGVDAQRGTFALVTNRHDSQGRRPDARSRGTLVVDCLEGRERDALGATYNPYNLLFATLSGEAFSATDQDAGSPHPLAPGIHGLSNGPIAARWPKTRMLADALEEWLAGPTDSFDPLFATLLARDLPPRYRETEGGGTGPARTGAPFIVDPLYGTRCSTVCAIRPDGTGHIAESRFDETGKMVGMTRIAFGPGA